MDALRRTRYAVTLLILTMALFVSAETAFLGLVQAQPAAVPSVSAAIPGTLVSVTLTGFVATDTSCTMSGTPVSNVVCPLSSGGGIATFTVAQYTRPGTYTITVTGSAGGATDTAQFTFTVNGFDLTLTPTLGETGTNVMLTMTNVPIYDTSCSISSPSSSSVVTFPGCAVSSGVGNGTFVVGNVAVGDYAIEVTACTGNSGCGPSAGDFAQQVFNVTSGPQLILKPAKGETGTSVAIEGGFFSTSDTTCTITSPTSGSFLTGAGCSVFTTTSGFKNVTGSFVVGNVPVGQYVVRVTGTQKGDFAEAVFNVTSGPQLILKPTNGEDGSSVAIEGGFFSTSDTTCTITSPSSGSFIKNPGCSTFITGSGFVNVTGSFVVGNVAVGQYVVQVTGSPRGDFAQAVFNVTSGPFIQLTGVIGGFASVGKVASGPVGTHVSISGSNFLPNDALSGATCTVSSPTSGSAIVGGACSFFVTPSGFVNATGSFVVGNVAEGQYVIRVSGSAGDSAEAVFNVTAGAFIQLGVNGVFVGVGQVASGPIGTHVSIEGAQFLPNDALSGGTCTLSSPSNGAAVSNGGCSFFKAPTGYVNVTGSFVVGHVPEGQYVIRVSGSAGDSAEAVFNVTAGAFIQLGVNGIFVPEGQVASGPIGTHVSIEGSQFLANDAFSGATCTVASPSSGSMVVGGACSFFKAPTGYVNVTGSFVVGNVPEGQYVIRVSGSAGDSAEAVFNVTAGAFIQLGVNGVFVGVGQVASGPTGASVSIEGSQFLPNDAFNGATCTVSSPTNGLVVRDGACSFFKTTSGWVNATGSFIVGNVNPGQYVIRVSGSAGDSAAAVFNVTRGPQLILTPNIGEAGTSVQIEGGFYSPADTTCSISSPTGGFILNGGCAVFVTTSGFKNVTGSFIVGSVAPGQYVVQVTGTQVGDFAQAVFNVTLGPVIKLTPVSGEAGTHVAVNGTSFLPTDNTCTITSPGSSAVFPGSAGCAVNSGTGVVYGSFIIGNVLPGQYVIQVTGTAGGRDFAQAVFNVTVGPQIGLSPGTAAPGHDVIVNGTSFLPTDTACVISSPGTSAVLSGSAGCAVRAGTGIVSGSFVVGNVVPGQYLIQVTGDKGDDAQAVLNVTSGPALSLSPGTGMIGSSITVNGTGFLTTDQSCSISSISSPNPILTGSAACAITVGTGKVGGTFIIGSVSPGDYVIEVTGCLGNSGCAPSAGDFAQTVLNVTQGAPTLTLSPSSAVEESTVTFVGTGLNPTDKTCSVQAINGATGALDNTLITSPTCSIVSPGIAQGTFVVSPYATTDISWLVQVVGSPVNDATPTQPFTVTPDVVVVPTSGTINTVFTFTGSGFESTATSCTATILPPFPASTPSCSIDGTTGQVSGSVVVPATAVAGTYGIVVTDSTGATATGEFTVGTPSALVVLNPASVDQSEPVGVAGTGFNPQDAYCVITSGGTPPWVGTGGVAPNCAISSGYASGSFVVSATAPGGYYLITIQACMVAVAPGGTCPTGDGLDFASNFLGVTLATTVTTYSTTTTSSSTTTSMSTTTTSVATSFSYSSTTYSTTGILFTSYTQYTQSTVSGQTTTTLTQTTSTTQTQTTVTVSTTTSFTTVPCGPLPCGFAIQPAMNPAPGIDSTGLLAALLLLIPMLLRRLFS